MNKAWQDAEDLLKFLGEHTGAYAKVRDGGILFAAAQRPRAVLVGHKIYLERLQLTDRLITGQVDSVDELMLTLAPYLKPALPE